MNKSAQKINICAHCIRLIYNLLNSLYTITDLSQRKKSMKKTTSLLLAAMVAGSLFATNAMADAKQGQKYYLKKLKDCKKDGIKDGGNFAAKHDRDSWAEKKESNELINAWKEICPSGASKIEKMKPEEVTDLYDFCWQYASDGDVPSCG